MNEQYKSELVACNEIEQLRKDAERLDFIEQRIRKSYTGVSFDWVPSIEYDPSGYRMMWRHTVFDQKKTLRAAIDEAMSKMQASG